MNLILAIVWQAAASAAPSICTGQLEAAAWPAADQLFRGSSRWIGGDGAYSIDLGDERVLWLFGDSLIDPSATGSRQSAELVMIANSIAIQTGYDPSTANLRFFWREDPAGGPSAFFAAGDDGKTWPGHGAMIGDRLFQFLMKVQNIPEGLGFEVRDWELLSIDNPHGDPYDWHVETLPVVRNEWQIIVGSGGVLTHDGFLYAFSAKEPGNQAIYLARWPESELHVGNAASMQWWADDRWVIATAPAVRPSPVMDHGPTEFTVHREPGGNCFVNTQTTGFGAATLTLARSHALVGPYADTVEVYSPPENDSDGILVYQGKAHPHLAGADLVLTYSTNRLPFERMLASPELYYPRFVRISIR